jgi:hypothetical protein
MMGTAVYWLQLRFGSWIAMSLVERSFALAACVLGGFAVYAGVCYAGGLRPASLALRGHGL